MEVDESPEGLLGRGASGDVKRGWFRGAPVALKSLFLLRTDAASTALLGGGIPPDQREAYLRKFMQVGCAGRHADTAVPLQHPPAFVRWFNRMGNVMSADWLDLVRLAGFWPRPLSSLPRRCFAQECTFMKTCTHPNIVPFYGVVSFLLRPTHTFAWHMRLS